MKYCNNCGKAVPDDAEFCPHCGIEQEHLQSKWYQKTWLWLVGAVLLVALVLSGMFFWLNSTNSNTTSNQHQIKNQYYAVKLKVIKTTNDAWDVVGTTKAPDGAKIIAVNQNKNFQLIENADHQTPTVYKGKFSGKIDGVAVDNHQAAGDNATIYLAAATAKNIINNHTLPKNIFSTLHSNKYAQKLTFTKSQTAFFNKLDQSITDSVNSSSTSLTQKEALKNEITLNYAALQKSDKFNDTDYNLSSAKIFSFEKNGNQTVLIVYINNNINELYRVYSSEPASKFIKNGIIGVSGKLTSRTTYKNVQNGLQLIPTIKASKIKILN